MSLPHLHYTRVVELQIFEFTKVEMGVITV